MIREVMRFSGPRMLIQHPILAFMHLIDNIRTGWAYPVRGHTGFLGKGKDHVYLENRPQGIND